MAQKVQIEIEAKDMSSGVLRAITSQFGSLGDAISKTKDMFNASTKFTKIYNQAMKDGSVSADDLEKSYAAMGASAARLGEAVGIMLIEGLKDSIKATMEYSAQVRDLTLASGASAEEASRLLQVLDDFEISAQDVTAATKALTANGLAPTIETIAKLSDKYVTLNSAQERNQFITENLGRGGLQWANALSKGGEALRQLNSEVDASLILTEQNLTESEKYRLALDNWNDAVLALKISIGNGLLPTLTDMLTSVDINRRAMEILIEKGDEAAASALRMGHANNEAAKAAFEQARAEADAAAATESAGNAASTAAESYTPLISMMERLNGATKENIKLTAYQDLKAKLSEGGLTEEELQILEGAGVALGVFDRNTAASARSIDELNKSLAAGMITLDKYISLLEEIPSDITTNISTNVSANNETYTPKAAGGEVYAGQPYMVGENGGERFIPAQNGRILGQSESLHAAGLGGGGTNYFYGNVTLQVGEETTSGILGYR